MNKENSVICMKVSCKSYFLNYEKSKIDMYWIFFNCHRFQKILCGTLMLNVIYISLFVQTYDLVNSIIFIMNDDTPLNRVK